MLDINALVRWSDRANVRGVDASNVTLLQRDNTWQVFNLAASRTVTLPSAGVKAGDRYTIENTSAFDLTVQSSAAGVLGVVNSNCAIFESLVDAPTTSAHWRLVGYLYKPGTVPGSTNGLAITAPNVGQFISTPFAGVNQSSPASSAFYDDTNTLTIPPGVWLISSNVSGSLISGSVSGIQVPILLLSLRSGSTTLVECYASSGQVNGQTAFGCVTLSYVVNISTSTVYKTSVRWVPNSGSPGTPSSISLYGGIGLFQAVRIA